MSHGGERVREIKFRAWDKICQPNRMKTWEQLLAQYQLTQVFSSNYFELMQYTGLKDKNGKEIYEGDIVKAFIHNGLYPDEWIGEVIFEKGQFGIRYGDLYKYFYTLSKFSKSIKTEYISNVGEVIVESELMVEVIGNIYENMELLE